MPYKNELSKDLFDLCMAVKAKRPRIVIDHILENGQITTEDLKEIYGYDHPPRAIQDVKEQGIPIVSFKVVSKSTGRKIAAYTFGDPVNIMSGRLGGRKAFSKAFKQQLVEEYGSRDAITGDYLEDRYLQIDHRIPYAVSGDTGGENKKDAFMLLDRSSQRAKSWSCEHCINYKEDQRLVEVCRSCFWAFPENYTHVALRQERRMDISWSGTEIEVYDRLNAKAAGSGNSVSGYVKELLKAFIESE